MPQNAIKTALILKTLGFLILVPGTVTVVLPLLIVNNSVANTVLQSFVPDSLGLISILTGIGICLWCFWDFIHHGMGTPSPLDPPRKLVVAGLYRYVRNPMYIGILLIIFGEAIILSSLMLIYYLLILLLFFHISVVFREEPQLKSAFGEQYNHYLVSVPRWAFKLRK